VRCAFCGKGYAVYLLALIITQGWMLVKAKFRNTGRHPLDLPAREEEIETESRTEKTKGGVEKISTPP
jgi:hypothetical protein